MSAQVDIRAQVAPKGVEFSDQLIVLGDSDPPCDVDINKYLPTPASAVTSSENLSASDGEMNLHHHHPYPNQIQSTSSSHRHHSALSSSDQLPPTDQNSLRTTPYHTILRPPGKRRACAFREKPDLISDHITPNNYHSDDDPVETSCTDSEDDTYPSTVYRAPYADDIGDDIVDSTFEQCTRINTKLNSLPSGGAFSLMNSSEDVDSSSSDESHEHDSRKLIRVDGSAKLSTASGLGDEEDQPEEDEFRIEGAERVDEEEAVNVRSFGRSFARVCLSDGTPDVIVPDPHHTIPHVSVVAFADSEDEPHVRKNSSAKSRKNSTAGKGILSGTMSHNEPLTEVFTASKSAPPRRKSRVRGTFTRRSSVANARKPKGRTSRQLTENVHDDDSDVETMMSLSCFPSRKSAASKSKSKNIDGTGHTLLQVCARKDRAEDSDISKHTTNQNAQVLAVPDMDVRKNRSKSRKMVKNISLQHDDWIDFTTNASRKQRPPWLQRLVSSNMAESPSSTPRGSKGFENVSNASSKNRRKFWKFWGTK